MTSSCTAIDLAVQATRRQRSWGERWGTEYVSSHIRIAAKIVVTPDTNDFMRFSGSWREYLLRWGQGFNSRAVAKSWSAPCRGEHRMGPLKIWVTR